MASTINYLDPRVLAELQGLALRTRHVVEGFLAGAHRNAHAGSSAEYSQHRAYVPGDDLRQVDWKAFGRTDRLYVKQFMDETNLACTFLLDASASMGYRGQRAPWSKFEYASCLVATLAWLLREQGDAVGLEICHGTTRTSIPAAASEMQLPEMIQAMEQAVAVEDADQGRVIEDWAMKIYRPHLVVIASDLFGDESLLEKSLIHLRQFGHEVMVFQICDRDEVEFPFDRLTEFSGLEFDDELTLDAELFRDGYLREFRAFQDRMRRRCDKSAMDYVPLVTDQPLGETLGRFLTARNSYGVTTG